jgi:hypothetical protein
VNNHNNCAQIDNRIPLNKHHAFLIVRMVIDPQGRLDCGTIVDVQGETVGRFRQVCEVGQLIERWLQREWLIE